MSNYLRLLPEGYYSIGENRLIFFCGKVSGADEARIKEMLDANTIVIAANRKAGSYCAYLGRIGFLFKRSDSGKINYSLLKVFYGKTYSDHLRRLFHEHTDTFTLVCPKGIEIIYNMQIHTRSGVLSKDTDWNMEEGFFRELNQKLTEYFEELSHEPDPEEADSEAVLRNSRRAERNVFDYFEQYTDKAEYVANETAFLSNRVPYFAREYNRTAKSSVSYLFYSDLDVSLFEQDGDTENPDTRYDFYKEGCSVELSSGDGLKRKATLAAAPYAGETPDGVPCTVFHLRFESQVSDDVIPQTGELCPSVLDKITYVRRRVLKTIKSPHSVSKYMFRTFRDFSTDGYNAPDEELVQYITESMDGKFPPNQMQMEAIIKGILSKDLLLVLGPPGTGKTTVIRRWAKYFIRKGMRVLISSQNNSAVDNVLQDFAGEKDATIIRLGVAEKVMDSCQGFLPENQIQKMRTQVQANQDARFEELAYNIGALQRMEEALGRIEAAVRQFTASRADTSDKLQTVRELAGRMHALEEAHTHAVSELRQSLDTIREQEEYLKNRDSRMFLVKLVTHLKAKRSEKALNEARRQLPVRKNAVRQSARDYNALAAQLHDEVKRLRAGRVIWDFRKERETAVRVSIELSARTCIPELRGYAAVPMPEPALPDPADQSAAAVSQRMEALRQYREACSTAMQKNTELRDVLGEWFAHINGDRNDALQDILISTCNLVGATCIGINTRKAFAKVSFDVAIIDESGQIQIHDALVPMSRAPKLLMLGDYKQIPPVADERVQAACESEGIDTRLLNISFFEYLFERMNDYSVRQYRKICGDEEQARRMLLDPRLPNYEASSGQRVSGSEVRRMIDEVIADPKKTVNLNTQFRMPGCISDIISEWFYDSNYYASYDMENYSTVLPGTEKPMVIIDTSGERTRFVKKLEGGGYYNPYEAELIAELVMKLILSQPASEQDAYINTLEKKIGIISAYKGQVMQIRSALRSRKLGLREEQLRSIAATLDSFQGQERPLIIYSFTRSDGRLGPESGRIGFMRELRRINVAFTRCKKQLVLVGDIPYLAGCRRVQVDTEEGEEADYPCRALAQEPEIISAEEIAQCAQCRREVMPLYKGFVCERQFGRFIRLMCQHVRGSDGKHAQGEYVPSSKYI